MPKNSHLIDSVNQHCLGVESASESHNEHTVIINPEHWLSDAFALRDQCGMHMLIDLCGVDYSAYGDSNWGTASATHTGFSRGVFDFEQPENTTLDNMGRFCVVYHLLDMTKNQRLRVKVYPEASDHPYLPSVITVWESANWYEREAFDLYGILFKNHPDLRRILTDYGFIGHPLRKDFPLEGHVEMIYDQEKRRVVYQPVSIKNRVNVPKVIRPT